MTDQPTTEPPAAYRELLTRLEEERAKAVRNAPLARVGEVRCALDGIASGLHIAIAHAITLFEGHQARQAYLAGSQTAAPADNPFEERIAALAEQWRREGPPPGVSRWWDTRLAELAATLQPPTHDAGSSVHEPADDDRRWRGGEKTGE